MQVNTNLNFNGSLFRGSENFTQRMYLSEPGSYKFGLSLTRGYVGGGYINNAGWTTVTTIQNYTDTWGTSASAVLSAPYRYGGWASAHANGYQFFADWGRLNNDRMAFASETVSAIANRSYGTLAYFTQQGIGYDQSGSAYGTKAYSLATGSTNYEKFTFASETFAAASDGSIYTGDQSYTQFWFDKLYSWSWANDGVTRKYPFSTETWGTISPSPNYVLDPSYWGKGLNTKDGHAYVHAGNIVKPFMKYLTVTDSYRAVQYQQTLNNDEQSPVMGQNHGYWAGGYNGAQNAHTDRVDYTTDAVRIIQDAPRALSSGGPMWSGILNPNVISKNDGSASDSFAANGSVTITQQTVSGVTYVKGVANQNTSTPGIWPIGGTISVTPGQRYRLEVRGYRVGSNAYLYVNNATSGADLVWTGPRLDTALNTTSTEFTVPASCTALKVGVLWSNPALNSEIWIDSIRLEPYYPITEGVNTPEVEVAKNTVAALGIPQTGLIYAIDANRSVTYPIDDGNLYDISGLGNHSRRSSSAATVANGYVRMNGQAIIVPGDPEIYSADFTWIIWHQYVAGSASPAGLFWSEAGVNNFLMAYINSGNGQTNPIARIDTPSTSYVSNSNGTQYNGFGSSTSTLPCKWVMTTIKKTGTNFRWYWNNGTLVWETTISDWFTPTPTRNSQPMYIGTRNDGSYGSNFAVAKVFLYNRALTDAQIQSIYSATTTSYSSLCGLPQGSISSSSSYCGSGTAFVTFTASAGTGPFLVVINGTSYNVNSGGTINMGSISSTTTYTLTSITDADGMQRTSSFSGATATVYVYPIPSVGISATATTVCAGSRVDITATGASNYNWSTGDNGSVITVYPTTTTDYTVTGTSTDGCQNTANIRITVNGIPSVAITGTNTICAGNSTTLTASGASSYTWSTGATGSSITVSPGSTTTYSVTGTTNGCSASASRTVTVNANPSIAINGNNIICAGGSTTLTASGASSYVWSNGTEGSSITVSPGSTTTYSVTGTDANGCSTTAYRTVTVNANPSVSIAPSSSTITAGQSVTLTASGASSYVWNTGATGSSITVSPGVGTHSYSVTGTTNGCTGTASASVTVISGTTTTTCTPAGTLLSTECVEGALWGVYANGSCGSYDAIIDPCHPDCGCNPVTCYEYLITNIEEGNSEFNYFNCEGTRMTRTLEPGATWIDCMQEGTVNILQGNIDIQQQGECGAL